MSLLAKIFGLKNQKKDSSNNRLFKEVESSHFLRASEVFSHGWNDPSEIIDKQNSILLDIICVAERVEDKVNHWNKRYYDFITQHYSISESQLESISNIIGVDKEKYRELYNYWPTSIDSKMYNKLYKTLRLNFVKPIKTTQDQKGKFIIVLNEPFWDIRTHNSNVLVDIINTYERTIHDFELFHHNYEDAVHYGLILMDRLCNERPPASLYHYHEKLKAEAKKSKLNKEQIDSRSVFQTLGFNINLSKIEEAKAEYNRIIGEKADSLKHLRTIFESITTKPFNIYRLV
jgi:hypothetical protein